MPGKLTLLLKSKLAWAILGAILIVGAGSTAALAATGTPLPLISQGQTSQHNDGQHNDGQHDHNDNGHQAEGTISSIDSSQSSFVVKTEHGSSVTVVVSSATVFTDGPHNFNDLKVGMSVEVDGNVQSDGTLTATGVHGAGEDANDDQGGGGNNGSDGSNPTPGTDAHSGSGPSGSSTPGSGSHDDGAPHN